MTGSERKDLRKSMNWYLARIRLNKVASLGAFWIAIGLGGVYLIKACQTGELPGLAIPAGLIAVTGVVANETRGTNFGLKRKYIDARQKIANANTNVIQKTR